MGRPCACLWRFSKSDSLLGVGDLMELDFADGSFDLVVAGNVLHLLNDPGRAAKQPLYVAICQVLQPN